MKEKKGGVMKKSTICEQVLFGFLAMGGLPLMVSCDDAQPEKAEVDREEEAAEEGEGLEAVEEAMKKKEEESQEESKARKEKREEKRSGGEGAAKASLGMKKR